MLVNKVQIDLWVTFVITYKAQNLIWQTCSIYFQCLHFYPSAGTGIKNEIKYNQ